MRAAASAASAAERLFFDPVTKDYMAIAAGTLDSPTGLKTVVQIHVESAGDYYQIDASIRQRAE